VLWREAGPASPPRALRRRHPSGTHAPRERSAHAHPVFDAPAHSPPRHPQGHPSDGPAARQLPKVHKVRESKQPPRNAGRRTSLPDLSDPGLGSESQSAVLHRARPSLTRPDAIAGDCPISSSTAQFTTPLPQCQPARRGRSTGSLPDPLAAVGDWGGPNGIHRPDACQA
jgi:hypothetical protein